MKHSAKRRWTIRGRLVWWLPLSWLGIATFQVAASRLVERQAWIWAAKIPRICSQNLAEHIRENLADRVSHPTRALPNRFLRLCLSLAPWPRTAAQVVRDGGGASRAKAVATLSLLPSPFPFLWSPLSILKLYPREKGRLGDGEVRSLGTTSSSANSRERWWPPAVLIRLHVLEFDASVYWRLMCWCVGSSRFAIMCGIIDAHMCVYSLFSWCIFA